MKKELNCNRLRKTGGKSHIKGISIGDELSVKNRVICKWKFKETANGTYVFEFQAIEKKQNMAGKKALYVVKMDRNSNPILVRVS